MDDSAIFSRRNLKRGTVLFREGDSGDCAFVIEKGKVRISKRDQGGIDRPLATLYPGEVFGEMAVIDPAPRMATATVIEDAVLLHVPAGIFSQRLKKMDRFMSGIMRVLIQHLRRLQEPAPVSDSPIDPTTGQPVAGLSTSSARAHHALNELLRTAHELVTGVAKSDSSSEMISRLGDLESALMRVQEQMEREGLTGPHR